MLVVRENRGLDNMVNRLVNLSLFVLVAINFGVQAKGFADLIGSTPIELQDFASRLKAKNFNALPKGILVVGQSGIGKTALVKALGQEVEDENSKTDNDKRVHLISKTAFELSNKKGVEGVIGQIPATGYTVLVIDGMDLFAKMPGGLDLEIREHVVILLEAMDRWSNVTVIGLSQTKSFTMAVTRSGRFATLVELDLPNQLERVALLQKFSQGGLSFDRGINLTLVSSVVYGFTPADLSQVVNYATLLAQVDKLAEISVTNLNKAIFKVFASKGLQDGEFALRLKVAVAALSKQITQKTGFARIVGPVPADVVELVTWLKDDQACQKFNLRLPKGILFAGPPGTGKTTLARALAEESGCSYMAASGAEFNSALVGSGGERVRSLFAEARKKAEDSPTGKTILFIDELDALGTRQGNSMDSTITSLLTEMDGFAEDSSVIVIAASNHPKNIDPALLRPGRFDKLIQVGLPDLQTRELLIKSYLANVPVADEASGGVGLAKLAQITGNFSPAEIKELIQKAGTLALRDNASQINKSHWLAAVQGSLREKILKGDQSAKNQLEAMEVALGVQTDGLRGFARIAGGVPVEVQDLVGVLRDTDCYAKFGLTAPKGILFAGPPGTGKTLLAKALAEELGCEFIETKGSAFVEMYVGVGAQRVRDLFEEARRKAQTGHLGKCIIFIDELDAVGSRSGLDGGNSETQRTIVELLTQMDGFSKDNSVIVIGATNNPSGLDVALLRPGRLDTVVEIGLPDQAKRKALLEMYFKKRPVDQAISMEQVAGQLVGFSPAEISELVNKAALAAVRAGLPMINQGCVNQAIRLIMASKKKQGQTFLS